MVELRSAFIIFGLLSDLPQIIIFTLRNVAYDGHYAKKLIVQNGTFWRFRASWCHQMPPALTLLFKLIFPCLKTQVQENNKVKYIHLMQNPVLLQKNKSSVKYATRLRTASINPVYEFARKQRFSRDWFQCMFQYPAGQ